MCAKKSFGCQRRWHSGYALPTAQLTDEWLCLITNRHCPLALPRQKTKPNTTFYLLFVRPDGKQLAQITNWVERQIVPVIDKVFGLDDNKQEQAKGKTHRIKAQQ